MRLSEVEMTVSDLLAAAAFYEQVLELPVTSIPGAARVRIGRSVLTLVQGRPGSGSHHLAITVPADQFGSAKRWLAVRLPLLQRDGADEFTLPRPWHSQSVYVLGPEDLLLELIARHDLVVGGTGPSAPAAPFSAAGLLCRSELGSGVDVVDGATAVLGQSFGLTRFDAGGPGFAPVGDPHGLLIVVAAERVWFPTTSLVPSAGALVVTLDTGTAATARSLQLGGCTLRSSRG